MSWKAVLADDEAIILNGMAELIDWSALDVEISGLAHDGIELEQLICDTAPDLVISDVRMPGQTGLDVIRKHKESGGRAQFILVSGYDEFTYAKEALRYGAVDYLLKPVRPDELFEAVKQAISLHTQMDAASVFREEKRELETMVSQADDESRTSLSAGQDLFERHGIDLAGRIFSGVCIGIRPDLARRLADESFERFNLMRFAIYNRITELFADTLDGFVIKRADAYLHLLAVFPAGEEANVYETWLLPIKKRIEEEYQTRLLIGIGMVADDPLMVKNAVKTAKYAFELYYFEERPVILFQEVHRSFKEMNDAFNDSVERVFRSIIARDGETLRTVVQTMDLIEQMYYGNRFAAENRCMHFTGMVAERLLQYKMIQKNFYDIQDELQERLSREVSYRGVRDVVLGYYEDLLSHISETAKNKDSVLIEDVKRYIREHYMEDLSISCLADVACVSKNYFSAMFKKETGMNYKAYLTGIRMEAALKLLQETDDRTYEIGEKVGYNNTRRFVEAFKQIYSVTPAEYRKSLRGN